jgi:hypothetical protein
VACASHTCIAGTCKGICAPGKLGCNGQTAQSCDWHLAGSHDLREPGVCRGRVPRRVHTGKPAVQRTDHADL